MSSIELSAQEKELCHQVARQSIQHGLETGRALKVDIDDFPPALQRPAATFVTLHKNGQLRGCIGALQVYQPLIQDVAEHAYAAAFSDPRFPALSQAEFPSLDIEISVLGEPEPISFQDEEDLLEQIRPGIDGLILEYGYNRGTFLPTVWEELPDKRDFLNHLKMKAGLPQQWWDNAAKVSRYETLTF